MNIPFLPTALATPGGRLAHAADAPAAEAPLEGFRDVLGEALVEPAPATRRSGPTDARRGGRSVEPSTAGAPDSSEPNQGAAAILPATPQVHAQVARSIGSTASKGADHAAPITTALRASGAAAPSSIASRRAEAKAPATRRGAARGPEPTPAPEAQPPARAASLPVSSRETHHAPGTTTPTAAPAQPLPLPSTPAGFEIAGVVLRSAAHLKVDAGVLGAVDLHLRVRDGAVHLRVEGAAAPLLEARSAELGGALASEGLKLGSIELPRPEGAPHHDGGTADQGEGRRQGWEEAADAREAVQRGGGSPRPATRARSSHDGSIDVQA